MQIFSSLVGLIHDVFSYKLGFIVSVDMGVFVQCTFYHVKTF